MEPSNAKKSDIRQSSRSGSSHSIDSRDTLVQETAFWQPRPYKCNSFQVRINGQKERNNQGNTVFHCPLVVNFDWGWTNLCNARSFAPSSKTTATSLVSMPRANGSQRRPGSGYVGDGWRAGGENSDLFEISQIGNRIWENFQCDWIRAITTCFSTWNLNASRKNAFQKGKPVTAPEAPMHFRAPGKMSF